MANPVAARAQDSRDPSRSGIVRQSTNPATAEKRRSQEPVRTSVDRQLAAGCSCRLLLTLGVLNDVSSNPIRTT